MSRQRSPLSLLLVAVAIAQIFVSTFAEGAEDADRTAAAEANKSNNPLNPALGLNFQDYYSPKLYGSDSYTNDFLLRGTLPLPPMGFVPVPELIRLTVPISTRPESSGGYTTGLGDINLFDMFILRTEGTQLGVGPLLTIPTAATTPWALASGSPDWREW